jgi:hypothetical protein
MGVSEKSFYGIRLFIIQSSLAMTKGMLPTGMAIPKERK